MKLTNEEQLNEINTRFSNRFQELLKKCEGKISGGIIVAEYVKLRDAELEGCNGYSNEKIYRFLESQRFNSDFYEDIFNHVEERIKDRLKGI